MESFLSIGKKIYNMNNPREVRRMWVFILRGYFHYQKLNKLDNFFQQNIVLKKISEIYPFVYEQPTRAFFYNKSNLNERINLVENHMLFMVDRFKADVVFDLYRSQPYILWEQGEGEEKLSLRLWYHPGQRKEGLLSTTLLIGEQALYQIMFWFNKDKECKDALWIGAMQGPNMSNAKEIIKQVTKRCHGYRTKNLILYMTQAVARALDIERIYAVTNYGYYANNHVRLDRKLKTSFSDFWHEAGGWETDDRRFDGLPLIEPRKSIDDVPTRKRAVYRRRFELLDDIDMVIYNAVKKLRK